MDEFSDEDCDGTLDTSKAQELFEESGPVGKRERKMAGPRYTSPLIPGMQMG